MNPQPQLEGNRIILRPFELSDAKDIQTLAGDIEIARTTLLIPHPYPDGLAEQWIQSQKSDYEEGTAYVFAIVMKENLKLIGAISLSGINHHHQHAELGYWVGVPYWGNGYCTEAVNVILKFGFESLNLNRIFAYFFINNPASGKVLQKVGMTREGQHRQHIKKYGKFVDIECYGLLRCEWEKMKL